MAVNLGKVPSRQRWLSFVSLDGALMHITKKRDMYLFLSVLGYANFIVCVTIGALLGRIHGRGVIVPQYANKHVLPHITTLLFQIYLGVSFVLLLVGVFAMQRRKALERDIGDYNPVTSRTI